MSLKKAGIIILLVLLIDQIVKIYIKTHFAIGESLAVTSWFNIVFVENEGMAWGSKLSDFISFISEPTSKIILTTFRLFAITAIGYWLYTSIQKHAPKVLVVAVSLIFAGALGNILDSLFYNYIFDMGKTFDPEINDWVNYRGLAKANFEGYGGFMQGCVVDMLQFPLFEGVLPDWIPFVGGKYFRFFEPVFNIADSAISIGVGILIVFNKKAFPKEKKEVQKSSTEA